MDIQIRQAGAADAPIIVSMVGELLHEIMSVINAKVFAFDPVASEARARFWLTGGTYVAFLAHVGEVALGFVALYESRALYAEGTFGTIPELYVRPGYRSQGVGTLLLDEANQYAKTRGWTRLEVTTPPLPQFERTLVFYEQHGFTVAGGRKMKTKLN